MRGPILGWDVGGANVKAARLERDEQPVPETLERPFPLWREPQRLPEVLTETADRLGGAEPVRAMAVTMTAELADCFATKREGVTFVLDAFREAFPDAEPWVYGVDGRFRSAAAARRRPHEVAAANWMASATVAARTCPDALFLDVGSTTTDVIPIVAGRVAARGRTDLTRLEAGELLYTGALRTPVCAIVRTVPHGGRLCGVAAEHFAVAADVYLWQGRIGAEHYTCETPDGRGRSRLEAGARLARMVCSDLEMLGPAAITVIAEHVARAQVRQIAAAMRRVRRRLRRAHSGVAVLAGRGAFLGRDAAQEVGLVIRGTTADPGSAGAGTTPAAAVAYLLARTADT